MAALVKRFLPFVCALILSAVTAFAYSESDFRTDDNFNRDLYRTGDVQAALSHAQKTYSNAEAAFGPAAINTLEAGLTLADMMVGVSDHSAALAFLQALGSREIDLC